MSRIWVEKGLISVIIPNYNGEAFLSECLDSLLEQSFKGVEIIVIDNASKDGSVELVRKKYPGVRLVRLDANRGFSTAVNAGIAASRGEFVLLLNSDTRAEADFVAELHKALSEKASAASMAAPKMLFARAPDTINSLGLGYGITGTNHDIGFGLKDGPRFGSPSWVFGPCGGAGMYRRSMFEDVGPFDEDFFMYYEDVDFCFRGQLAGHKCVFVPTARVYHIEGASGESLPRPRNFYFARNSFTVVVKNFPRRLLLRYWHVVFWEMAKRAGSALLKGDISALSGYVVALPGIRNALKKRVEAQKRKRVSDTYIEGILRKNRSVLKEINLGGRPVEEPQ